MKYTSPFFAPLLLSCFVLLISGCRSLPVAEVAEEKPSPIKSHPATRIDAFLDKEDFHSAHWGVLIETVDGRILYARNHDKGFTPASTLKVVTTAAALDILGPDYTFETNLEMRGEIDPNGVLNGDLVIVGNGDPSPGSWHLGPADTREAIHATWIAAIRDHGITSINGDVVGDGRFFTEDFFNTGWPYGWLPYWFAAGSSGLAFEENAWRCRIFPGESIGVPARIEIYPNTDYFTIINRTVTSDAGTVSTVDSVNHMVEGNTFLFSGQIPMDREVVNERGSVWDGPRYAAHLLGDALKDEGIPVSGGAWNILDPGITERIDSDPGRDTLNVYTSPPLTRLAEVVNRVSHNFFADQILRTIGAEQAGEGSFSAGTSAVVTWLESIGAPRTDQFHMRDGSGLAPSNVVQPRHLNHVLRWAGSGPETPAKRAFRRSLSTAGIDDALTRRYADAPEWAFIRAKTGYIGFSRTITGYVTNAEGERLVYTIMANNHSTPNAPIDAAVDEIVLLLANSHLADFGVVN